MTKIRNGCLFRKTGEKANVSRNIKSTSFTVEVTIGTKGTSKSNVYIEIEYGDVDLRV